MSGNLSDGDLDRLIRSKLSPLRAGRTECPSSESLNAYALGMLDESSSREVREHVARCGICDALLLRMREFDKPPQKQWSWWPAAIGYALSLLLAYPAYLGLRPKPSQPPPPASQQQKGPITVESLPGIGLRTTRAPGVKTAPAGDSEHFFIQFFVPVQSGFQYRATISRKEGIILRSAIPIRSWDGLGNFVLLFRSADFPAGGYRIEIEEINQNASRTNSWSFDFER